MSNGALILTMGGLFLGLGYLGVPVAFSIMAGGSPAGPHRPPHEVMLKPG